MTTQTALVIQKIGAPITAVNDWPIPQPGPKQIQIRVTVTALNPHDQKGRDLGLFVKDDLPNILGSDIVGVVTVCGQDATRFNVGDRVFGQGLLTAGSASKGLQQYSLLDEVSAALVPTGFSDDECVTLPTNVLAGKDCMSLIMMSRDINP
jgi:NADPH2:quinone reductase